MRRTRMQWMTSLALVGTMSLSLAVAARRTAQEAAEVPPVPPPAGETTPIPPPPPAAAPGAAPRRQRRRRRADAAGAPRPTPTGPRRSAARLRRRPRLRRPRPQPAPTPRAGPDADSDAGCDRADAGRLGPLKRASRRCSSRSGDPSRGLMTRDAADAPRRPPLRSSRRRCRRPVRRRATEPAVAERRRRRSPISTNPALAERLTSMATGLLRSQPPSNALWRYTTSLLQAATRLAPDEPRYPRLLIEAAGRAGDEEVVVKALEKYRKLVPTDEHAQAQLIDLYLRRMQSADDRVKYLRRSSTSPQVAAGGAIVRGDARWRRRCGAHAERAGRARRSPSRCSSTR